MAVFYNEKDAYIANWLENLIVAGQIPAGIVETTPIQEIVSVEHKTAHFFAGIGGWAYALKLAGWPEDLPVWTGSCPCQPFSTAGHRQGFADDRHLWPEWYRLIQSHRPPVILGEQVASPAGRAWLDLVQSDLEAIGYSTRAADISAAGVGAPHKRQRFYFVGVGHTSRTRPQGPKSDAGRLTDPSQDGWAPRNDWENCEWLSCSDRKSRPVEAGTFPLAHGISARMGRVRAYGNAVVPQAAAVFARSVLDALGIDLAQEAR